MEVKAKGCKPGSTHTELNSTSGASSICLHAQYVPVSDIVHRSERCH